MEETLHKELSIKVLGMAFTIHNILGPGLLEHAYEEAFCIELKLAGINFERQKVFALFYKGEPIGGYIADLVVDDKVILELKSVQKFSPVMEAVAGEPSPDLITNINHKIIVLFPHPWGSATLGRPWPS
jgi:GxxExxY protein